MSKATKALTMTPEFQARAMAQICSTGIPDDVSEIESQILQLIRERAYFLTACEAIVHATKLNDPQLGAVAATLARAAIAKATGDTIA